MDAFRAVACTLRDRYLPYHEGRLMWRKEQTGNKTFAACEEILLAFIRFVRIQCVPCETCRLQLGVTTVAVPTLCTRAASGAYA